jgi:hypothetical protein
MKKWLDRYDGGGQTPARDNTTVYHNRLPIAGPKLPAPSYISATPDYKDSEWYKQESEDYKRRRNITQPILHAADVTTDIMQLGRFIPLPQAQAIGTLGSELGLLIDSYQAADAYANNDYVNSGINAASTLIPLYMSRTKFLRDMHNTKPGSLADKIASYGNRSGTYLPLSGIRPNLIKNPVMRKAVNQNKKTLLGLAAETAYDSYAEGGESMNAGWLDRYAEGGPNLEDMKANFLQQYRPSPQADNTRLGSQKANVTNDQAQQLQKDAIRNAQRAAEERARLANARQTMDNESVPFTFPTGEKKKWADMDSRERNYVRGQSLRTKGRINEEGRETLLDYVNPLNWYGNMAANAAEAPYMARQTNSIMPYVMAAVEPLVAGRMMGSGSMNPFKGKFYTNSISDADFINSLGLGIPKAGINLASKLPLEDDPINLSKILEYYNRVATGESALPFAWKSPAVGLSQEASDAMFKGLSNANNLTDAERALLTDYQHNSTLYTGRYGNVDEAKRQALNNIINSNDLNINNNAIFTRRFNPNNNSVGAVIQNNRLNFGDRPTSFSAGVGSPTYGSGTTDRLVIPNRYAKKMGRNFLANQYDQLPENAINLVDEPVRHFASSIGTNDNTFINQEREVIGTGLNFKRIGKVKNDIGGYDWIVKPLERYVDGGQKYNKLSAEEIKNISAYTDFLNGDSPFLNRLRADNTSSYIPANNNPINIVNTPGALLNRKGDQNVFNRGASFLEFQNRMNEAKPVSLNPRVSKQNDIIRSLPTNGKNYAIIDKKADSIFYFNPQGENITGEPVITGASRNDLDKGLSMAQWMKETGDTDHEHYFEYLKQNNLQTTPSGIFHLNRLRTDVAQDPNRAWRFINSAFRPDRARTVYENRIKDYGPRQLMYTFSDENNKPSSKAIHGTAREQRLDAFNNPNSDRALSNGCINVNGKSICFNALVPGSNLYILPEKSNDYLYPQKKMDVNKLSPLNDYYEDGGSIHNWRDVKVPHKKNQLSGWLDEL